MKSSATLTVLLSLTALFSLAQDTAGSIQPAPADKAVIYFVRPSMIGLAINFTYFDSTKLIGKFNGRNYIRYECSPGKHLFWARSENRDFVEADVEAGKIYFLEARPEVGLLTAVGLEPVEPGDEKRMKRMLKLLERKSAKRYTPEELAVKEAGMKRVIAKGMEKYNSDKKKGKVFPKLERSRFYTI